MKAGITAQSFIIKIWYETDADSLEQPQWYGQITHVISGEQFVFENMEDMKAFMAPYVQAVDIEE